MSAELQQAQPPSPALAYLVRHGATANNTLRPPRLQGRGLDCAISDVGQQQAHRTAARLAPLPFARVVSSPMLRARQTAEAIAALHGLTVEVVPELVEVDVGRWEGLTWAEAERIDPAAYRGFTTDPGMNPYSGGENLSHVLARVRPVVERLLGESAGQLVAIVAHNVVNRVYLADLLAVPLAEYRRIAQNNCCINILQHAAGQTRLVTMNAVDHLEGGLLS